MTTGVGKDQFDQSRRALTSRDLELLLDHVESDGVQEALNHAGTRMQVRHVRGAPSRLLAAQLRTLPRARAFHVSEPLVQPMLEAARDALGERAPDPSAHDLLLITDALSATFSPTLLWFFYAWVSQSALPAAGAAADALSEVGPEPKDEPTEVRSAVAEDAREDEQERTLFTTLDESLIRSVVAACTETIGAFPRTEVRALVDEVVKLNSSRHPSWFHVGFLDALDDSWSPDLPAAGMNKERRTWLLFGRLSGWTRREDREQMRQLVSEDWTTAETVVADVAMGSSLTAPIVHSLMEDEPRRAARMLAVRQTAGPFNGWPETVQRMHERARRLLSEQRVPEAQKIWEVLADYPPEVSTSLGLDVARRLATCDRAADDFAAAQRRLDGIAVQELPDGEHAVIHTERGLVAAEIQHLRHLSLDRAGDPEQLAARLGRGEEDFRRALEVNKYEWRANLCLGVLNHLRDEPDAAATALQLALSGMRDEMLPASEDFEDEVRFHAGLSRLQSLEPGADGPAFAEVRRACTRTWRPNTDQVFAVANALLAYQSRHVADWLLTASTLLRSPAPLAEMVLEQVRQGERRVVDLARKLGRSRKVSPEMRLDLLTGLLDHAASLSSESEDGVLDEIDDLLQGVEDAETDRLYAQWLDGPTARELLGATEARLRQVEVRRRLGEVSLAQDVLEEVIHRVVAEANSPYDPEELLESFRALAPEEDRTNALASLLRPRTRRATPGRVHLTFVGGNETQEAFRDALDRELEQRYDGNVTVRWIFPGWSSNWTKAAEAAERQFRRSHGLVLMRFVRTNLGRRLRRTSGEAGIPWVACTGSGKGSILRSIDQAVALCSGE